MSSRTPNPKSRHKRSLSTSRSTEAVNAGGDKKYAAMLKRALNAPMEDRDTPMSLTHALHTYPARMHPGTARVLLSFAFEDEELRPDAVLDPFAGSGTTLVEAHQLGVKAIGVDLNPIAVMLASIKSQPKSKSYRRSLKKAGLEIAERAIAEGKAARRSGYKAPPPFRPEGLDPAHRERVLKGWFARHVRAELEFLAGSIAELGPLGDPISDALRVCLSAVVVKASRRSSDTDKEEIQKNIGRGAAARWFQSRVELLWAGLEDMSEHEKAATSVYLGDARHLEEAGIPDQSVGAVITSPPYLGTYDYAEHHDLRAALLGLPLDAFGAGEIASRRAVAANSKAALDQAQQDFKAVFAEMHRVIAPGGIAMVVMGDSVAGRHAVWADEIIDEARGELQPFAWAWQARRKWGGVEGRAFGSRPKREHILLLRRE